jgi:ATP-dependent helicase Lhr and Lhr-like helicase
VTAPVDPTPTLAPWFERVGWSPFRFQREAWTAYLNGLSGLIHSPTGTGKTHAAWLGPVAEALAEESDPAPGLRVVWITPLRALATDTVESLRSPLDALGLGWTVEKRIGETSSAVKKRQRERPPNCLVTTPESLTILLSYADAPRLFRNVRCIVADEWHELMATKRGVQAELAMARVRRLSSDVRTWGLSATLGNTEQAMRVLLGERASQGVLIRGRQSKRIEIETIIPPKGAAAYPWAGHLGTRLVGEVLERIERAQTTLLFTNTRSQAELWFRALNTNAPHLIGAIALHHGSLDAEIRREVERLLRAEGESASPLRCVVCTSSLDLGVDFWPVDQVIQIGSPKGVARLVQRAGRSGHRPGLASRVLGTPTHALELIEFAAVRRALAEGRLESRPPLEKPLDVLAQHLVTVAMGGGFTSEELLGEIRETHAFRDLTDEEWTWTMDFCVRGGAALTAYPRFARLAEDPDAPGRWTVAGRAIATAHRMAIGTIVSDAGVLVKYTSGRTLGAVEESFVANLRPGDRFVFAGRVLRFEKLREMTAFVTRAKSARGAVPRWSGGRMPLSTQLSDSVRTLLDRAAGGEFDGPEMQAVRPLLERQAHDSVIPRDHQLLIEQVDHRRSRHFFLYPLAGRLTHEGLGALISTRLARRTPVSAQATPTDYGIELLCETPVEIDEPLWRELLSSENLLEDLLESLNSAELARRHFREIARIAGLTSVGHPGRKTSSRHMQASSEMFFDVFREFDPGNLLLTQAKREVLESQLEFQRLRSALDRIAGQTLVIKTCERLTPLAFPLWAESLRATHVSSETWEARVRRMAASLEEDALASASRTTRREKARS